MLFNNNVLENPVQEAAVQGIDFEVVGNDMLIECAYAQCEISAIMNAAEAKAMEAYVDAMGNEAVIESTLEYVAEEANEGMSQKIKNFFTRILNSLKEYWVKFTNWLAVKIQSHEKFLEVAKRDYVGKGISGKATIHNYTEIMSKIDVTATAGCKDALDAVMKDKNDKGAKDTAENVVTMVMGEMGIQKVDDSSNADAIKKFIMGDANAKEQDVKMDTLVADFEKLLTASEGMKKVGVTIRNAITKMSNLFAKDEDKKASTDAMAITNFLVMVNNICVNTYKEMLLECRTAMYTISEGAKPAEAKDNKDAGKEQPAAKETPAEGKK